MGVYQQTGQDKILFDVDNFDFTGTYPPSSQMTADGELLIGQTGANPTVNTLTAGAGISITNGAGSITIAASGSGMPWTEVVAATVGLAIDNGYIMNRATTITATLPAVAAFGSVIIIGGKGAGLTRIAQNAGQTIHFGSSDTTTGVGGRLDATGQYDTIELVCITANTDWLVQDSIGSWTVT